MKVTEPCMWILYHFLLYPVNLYFKFIFIDKLMTHEMCIVYSAMFKPDMLWNI